MKFRGLATGVASVSLLLWTLFVVFSAAAQAWSEEKCRNVVFSGNEYKFNAKTIDEMIQKIESTNVDDLGGDEVIRSPWEMGMIPNLAARKIGYQEQLKMISSWVRTHDVQYQLSHATTLNDVREILKGNREILRNLDEENPKLTELMAEDAMDYKAMDGVNPVTTWSVCFYYQPLRVNECYRELNKIVHVMAPVNGITARDRIYQVMKNPKFQEPLAKLAQEYLEIIESGAPAEGRKLDEDLLRVLGSENMKWTVLAVLSARGANFYRLFEYASKKDFRTLAALGVIASAALYFDSLNKDMFSFPRGVEVDCDSGKSYHFWMSAYLSRRFGSKWAAYLSEVGYQMKSKTEFRDPNRAFTDRWNSVGNEKIRLDLAYSAAGAYYGEYDRNQYLGKESHALRFHFDIDETVDMLEESSERLVAVPKEQVSYLWTGFGAGAFVRWNRIFHPEKAMEQ